MAPKILPQVIIINKTGSRDEQHITIKLIEKKSRSLMEKIVNLKDNNILIKNIPTLMDF